MTTSSKYIAAQFELSLSKVLENVLDGLTKVVDGKDRVVEAFDNNIRAAERYCDEAKFRITELESQLGGFPAQRELREQQLRRLVDVYEQDESLPSELKSKATKLRTDIAVLKNLEKLVSAKMSEEIQLRDTYQNALATWQGQRQSLTSTYHAALGQRVLVTYLADYRKTRLTRIRTQAEIDEFNEKLTALIKGIKSLDQTPVVELAL